MMTKMLQMVAPVVALAVAIIGYTKVLWPLLRQMSDLDLWVELAPRGHFLLVCYITMAVMIVGRIASRCWLKSSPQKRSEAIDPSAIYYGQGGYQDWEPEKNTAARQRR